MVLRSFEVVVVLRSFEVVVVLRSFEVVVVLRSFEVVVVLRSFDVVEVLRSFEVVVVLRSFDVVEVLRSFEVVESLQNKSYNHFAAIYYLLVERLKAHRCSFPVEQRLDARQRRPSTIAEQTVVKSSNASAQTHSPLEHTFMVDEVNTPKVNGCMLDPLPPSAVLRKSSTSSPSNMMETSIDEGIETEEPDTEDDPPHLLSAYQTARFGQRRHTLSEVTNQPGQHQGKLFPLGHNPSMGSVDSDMGYDMGSVQSDFGLLEESSPVAEVGPSQFLISRVPNPTMDALSSHHREAHNRSPISFREGRRASDTSLTQGLVAFRQHLQNLARTKGILELNKVQMLVEQMDSAEGAMMGPLGQQHHLHNLLEGEASKQHQGHTMYQSVPQPPLLSRRQSLETQYFTHRLQASVMANSPASCQLFCKEAPRSLEQQLQEHRLNQKRMYLHQSQGMGLQTYFNQMQIAEGSFSAGGPADSSSQVQQSGPAQASSFGHPLSPLLEPSDMSPLLYEPYMSPQHYPSHINPSLQMSPHQLEASALSYSYPTSCEPALCPGSSEALTEHYHFPLEPCPMPPSAHEGELQASILDTEMMETVDPQHGFVLVN
uniref:Uncharacterized protein n=2 Tax=Knipowitschia caucasica TaxID=637954 RepID=A0AAV2J3N8_KNICA